MFGFRQKDLVYVKVPKNGCMTYTSMLIENGWDQIDLNYSDLSNCTLFGHLTEPNRRHTRGLSQYLLNNELTYLLDDPNASQTLISGVFDEHTFSVSMMCPLIFHKVYWIPLDYLDIPSGVDGDRLTQYFLKTHNIHIDISKYPRLNVASDKKKNLYHKVDNLKLQNPNQYAKLVKNFLEPDLAAYHQSIDNVNTSDLVIYK